MLGFPRVSRTPSRLAVSALFMYMPLLTQSAYFIRLASINLDGSSARAQWPLAYVIQPEPQPVRLCLAKSELWLALSSSDALEHPCTGARARGPPSVRAAPAMQSLGTIRVGTVLPSSFCGRSKALLPLQIAILTATASPLPEHVAMLQKRQLLLQGLELTPGASRLQARCARSSRLHRTCVVAECLASHLVS